MLLNSHAAESATIIILHRKQSTIAEIPICWMFLQQAHDKTLVSINNHLVNGKGDDGVQAGGGVSGGKLSVLKEEVLRELEKRVSLSCSSCQVTVISHSSMTVWLLDGVGTYYGIKHI